MEVVVALALGATVMVALFGMYESVLDASDQIRKTSQSSRAARVAVGVIEDDLRSLCRVPDSDLAVLAMDLDEDTGAEGETALVMTTSATLDLSAGMPHLGVQIVEYVIEKGADGDRFVRRERPFAGITGDFDWIEVVILDGVKDFKVEVWSSTFGEFTDDWELGTDAGLPLAVRVSFEQAQGQGARRYELVVPLSWTAGEAS